jgi:3-deoxy-D-manno-octulosonic-acid transferase
LCLYIPKATVNQYVALIERFAFIQELSYIELKLDTSSQFCNENSIGGTTSILELIKNFKEKLPSLKVLKLIFRERDFELLSKTMKL